MIRGSTQEVLGGGTSSYPGLVAVVVGDYVKMREEDASASRFTPYTPKKHSVGNAVSLSTLFEGFGL